MEGFLRIVPTYTIEESIIPGIGICPATISATIIPPPKEHKSKKPTLLVFGIQYNARHTTIIAPFFISIVFTALFFSIQVHHSFLPHRSNVLIDFLDLLQYLAQDIKQCPS